MRLRGMLAFTIGISGVVHAAVASCAQSQASPALPAVERIIDLSLADAAVAVSDPFRPVIYYNPVILERAGPALAAFILAHEDAHITLQHTRVSGGSVDPLRLRRLELEADCAAARDLASRFPEALAAAAKFFRAMGSDRMDSDHPTGMERATRIESCAQASAPSADAAPSPAPVTRPASRR